MALDTMMVLGASYDTEDDAVADYEAVKEVYRESGLIDTYDAAVISKHDDGKVKIVKKHEQPTRHGAWGGLGIGLVGGALVALFPAAALGGGLLAGGAAGAGLGALGGHVARGMSRSDLKDLGELLDDQVMSVSHASGTGLLAVVPGIVVPGWTSRWPLHAWELPLPDGQGTRAYLARTLEQTLYLLAGLPEDAGEAALYFFRLVALHEQMHAEAAHFMGYQLGIALSEPLRPAKPLAQRPRDILPLARHFLPAGKRLGEDAERALLRHAWPGNVRELRNAVQRAALLARGDAVNAVDLDLPLAATAPVGSGSHEEPDRASIEAALERNGGVLAQAAADLGLSRQALYRRLDRLGISRG